MASGGSIWWMRAWRLHFRRRFSLQKQRVEDQETIDGLVQDFSNLNVNFPFLATVLSSLALHLLILQTFSPVYLRCLALSSFALQSEYANQNNELEELRTQKSSFSSCTFIIIIPLKTTTNSWPFFCTLRACVQERLNQREKQISVRLLFCLHFMALH